VAVLVVRRHSRFLQHDNKTNNRKDITMKFMITWQFQPGKLHDTLSHFAQMTPEQDAADRGSSIKLIGRWHDFARGRGVIICEADSAEAVSDWALNWNSILDLDVAVVLDDNEARALGKKRAKRS
jgi:hypothetical protein